MPDGSAAGVVVLAELPPPVNGMTAVTAEVVELLRERGGLAEVLRGGRGEGASPGWARVRRLVTLLLQVPRLVGLRLRGRRRLYLPCDSGVGLLRILATVTVARALGYVVVLHHHVFTYIDARSGVMAAIARVGGRGLVHVFLCEHMATRFAEHYRPRGRIAVVSNAAFFEAGGTDGPRPRRPGPLRVGLFGNLNADKGVPALLAVAERFAGDPRLELHAGGPVDDAVRAELEAAEGRGELRCHGPRYGADRDEFLGDLDLLLFPSTYAAEAEPMVVWEAIAAGVPVVAYRRGCIPAQLPESHVVGGIEELVAWIRRFVADPAPARVVADRLRSDRPAAARRARDELWDTVTGWA